MTDYDKVADALKEGAEPRFLCATCPWDRFCITPPSMTSEDVQAAIDRASAADEQRAKEQELDGHKRTLPVAALLTAVAMGGRDTSAGVCPVFALRLRSSDGESVARAVKAQMQSWDDNPR